MPILRLVAMLAFACLITNASRANAELSLTQLLVSNFPVDVQVVIYRSLADQGMDTGLLTEVSVESDSATSQILVTGSPDKHSVEQLAFVGTQLALFMPFSVTGTWAFSRKGEPWVDADLNVEMSHMLQFYSAGGAYHPLGWHFFAGGRAGLLQLHEPWSRGFDPEFDNQIGIEPELGFRGWLFKRRLMYSVSTGALWVPSSNTDLPLLYRIKVGVAYRVFKR
jgi:hypothetical protein